MRYLKLLLPALLLLTGSLFAQEPFKREDKRPVLVDDIRNVREVLRGDKQAFVNGTVISNLSNEQLEKIGSLLVEKYKKLNKLSNELVEQQARQQTLEAQDQPDMKKIDKLIDEQVATIGRLMKLEASYKQKVRALLTDAQRVEYDINTRRFQ